MDWLDRMNEAVAYIEEHLADTINLEEVGKIACCSSYHFQRIFSYMANVSLAEYIRRRRMSLAAVDLQSGTEKVIDIALKYGYDSPTAFNRAFQNVHGFAPSKIKNNSIAMKAFPPISFQITIKGAVEMNFRIVQKEAFRVVGISVALEQDIEKSFDKVPKLWAKVAQEGLIPRLIPRMDGEPKGLLGISSSNQFDNCRYYIAVASNLPLEDGMEEFMVPAETWAVFYGEGVMPGVVQDLEKRIVTDWLPTSGYEYANAPDMEVYLDSTSELAKFEVWMPVIKK